MSLIQITPETLHMQANTVRQHKTQQANAMKKLSNLVDVLNESWKGEAQDAFVAKFHSMSYTYRQLSEVLDAYAKLMDKAANEMQVTDQNLKNMIQNIW